MGDLSDLAGMPGSRWVKNGAFPEFSEFWKESHKKQILALQLTAALSILIENVDNRDIKRINAGA